MKLPVIISVFLLFCLSNFFVYAGSADYIRYKVRRGDALEKIARKFGVSVQQLKRWNRLRRDDRIFVGQRLKIFIRERQVFSPPPKFRKPARYFRVVRNFDKYGDIRHYGWLGITDKSGYVFAAANGKVVKIGYRPSRGTYILVDHSNGWLTMYSHLKKVLVKKGEYIRKSQKIAISENRKLFFLISRNGVPLDPARFL
ncbi:MAG: LysM peptidoglycan-binding domain-containing protein [Candidatus Hydrogenedentota bacterium]|nr:MAG: LysM peptidoglycan-binding domain-containing protein [Candidatus Hydrogenedentota bacterium]